MAFEGVCSVGNIATAKVRAAEGLSTGGACLFQVKGKKDFLQELRPALEDPSCPCREKAGE